MDSSVESSVFETAESLATSEPVRMYCFRRIITMTIKTLALCDQANKHSSASTVAWISGEEKACLFTFLN